MTATAAQIRDALLARLKATPGLGEHLGVVHAYERYSTNPRGLVPLYRPGPGPSEIRGWFLRRLTARPRVASNLYLDVEIRWRLRGYLSIEDDKASELAMQELAERIMADLWSIPDETLGGLVLTLGPRQGDREGTEWGWQLVEFQPVVFAGVLCHMAALELTTTHEQPRGIDPDDFLTAGIGWQLDHDPDPDAVDQVELEQ